jgi:hypothetical protein
MKNMRRPRAIGRKLHLAHGPYERGRLYNLNTVEIPRQDYSDWFWGFNSKACCILRVI